MRHKKKGRKLGRKAGNRRALLMNLASQMITYKSIKTTDAKAKELRKFIEPLITLAKEFVATWHTAIISYLHYVSICANTHSIFITDSSYCITPIL